MELSWILLIFLQIQASDSREDDEFYCKREEFAFETCRRCPTLNENCEAETCTCGNIISFDKGTNNQRFDCVIIFKPILR